MFDLTGKIAIITGGGSGIGKAISLLFGKQGAIVHILELNSEAAETVAAEIEETGGRAFGHAVDVSKQDELLQVVATMESVDILVNNAGIAHVGNLENCSEADFERVYRVNVKGAYNALYSVIPRMKAQRRGTILNLASIAAQVGIADRFAYSMSKGAIAAMTMSVARDYMHAGIRCNSISPARVHTPFVDGFIAKNYPGKEEECLLNYRLVSPLVEWLNQKKLQN